MESGRGVGYQGIFRGKLSPARSHGAERMERISNPTAIPWNGGEIERNFSRMQIKKEEKLLGICTNCAAVSGTATGSGSMKSREADGEETRGVEEKESRGGRWRSTEDDEWVGGRDPAVGAGKRKRENEAERDKICERHREKQRRSSLVRAERPFQASLLRWYGNFGIRYQSICPCHTPL
ncbi:uncharacterized protein BJX67DRAFT_206542 [Aspergillus lucknowensis]|uniref:Uncharacterized protein n=1 Tax=Aspergillus lucknowensis TaxID=176173 RepID=A0ABR4LJ78_9EURO